ncbi:DoxX family protein [Plantactinospora sp. GCM10030261]|uniref:DoxX family protein n=1 Tax=Plantactinospora sp. GCM10030261 TaxID=3273420 RepID=UPI00360B6C11
MKPVRAVARAMLSGIFVINGARAVANPEPYVSRAKPVTDRVAPVLERTNPRLPTDTASLVRVNGAVQLAAGLLLATGHLTRPAAAMLAGTLVPTTLAGHAYWTVDDPTQRMNHKIHFMKNLSVLGGLLLAAADTEGRPSLRWRAGHAVGGGQRKVRSGQRKVRRAVRTARRDARIAVWSASAARRMPG